MEQLLRETSIYLCTTNEREDRNWNFLQRRVKLEFHFAVMLFVLACLLAALSRDFVLFCLGAGFFILAWLVGCA
jgi:uncharacterized membrane protein